MSRPHFADHPITVDDGKYTFRQTDYGGILVDRHGEPWLRLSVTHTEGYNAIHALLWEIWYLRHPEERPK